MTNPQLADTTEKLGTIAWDQAPLLLKDILTAGIVANGLVLGACAAVVSTVWWATRGMRKYDDKLSDYQSDNTVINSFGWVIPSVVNIIGGFVGLTAFYKLLIIHFAPRVYLIDWLRNGG